MEFEKFDRSYVQRLTDGDPAVEKRFAVYFGDLLFLKLRVRLRSPELIEDISQETLKRVLEFLKKGRDIQQPECFGAFVTGVCERVLKEFCRSEGRAISWDDTMDETMDENVDPDANLVRGELKREIQLVFSQLHQKDRVILQAVYLDELDKAEICRRYGINPNYLRVLVYRAKAQFRKVYLETIPPH